MKKATGLLGIVGISCVVALILLVLSQPISGEIKLLPSGNTTVVKEVAQEVFLSGTVITISVDDFRNKELTNQTIILESYSAQSLLRVHYLSKENSISYHAFQDYSSVLRLTNFANIQIDGGAIKYTTERSGLVVFSWFMFSAIGAIIVLALSSELRNWLGKKISYS